MKNTYITTAGILTASIQSKGDDYINIALQWHGKKDAEIKTITTDAFSEYKTLDAYIESNFNVLEICD